jgi:plasmid stabilization system protein ParE
VKPALFTALAEADVEEAFKWYETQRPGLGGAFRHAVDVAVASAEENPEAYAVPHRGTRRVILTKFPYGLYYVVTESNIIVVGRIHAKRHPRTWRGRGAG